MIDDIRSFEADASKRATEVASLEEVRALETELVGKRSPLADFKKRMGGLDHAERRHVGQALNEVQASISAVLAARREELEAVERRDQLERDRLDLTEVRQTRHAGHLHLVTQTIERLEDVFVGLGFTVSEGPEVEDDWHNFTALNFLPQHPARDMQDTFFVDLGDPGDVVMRTHTSPVQIRVMESTPPPIYTVAPGRVFRQEATDATHLAVFHQIEALVIDRGITFGDLAGTIDAFTRAFFGSGVNSRLRPSYFPFTEPSAEFDVQRPDGSWLELGGSGMVHPNVLRNCGLDPEEWSGFAFGFGLDRLATSKHGISDIRDLFTNDVRFLEQF